MQGNPKRPTRPSWKEAMGLTKQQNLELMEQLKLITNESDRQTLENILAWHCHECPMCSKTYFPSGSKEVRCWDCQNLKHRPVYKREYMREYMRNYRRHKSRGANENE